jgi:hypothetical protein
MLNSYGKSDSIPGDFSEVHGGRNQAFLLISLLLFLLIIIPPLLHIHSSLLA